ncbi:hypothetical protein KBX31_10415 [Liquorilactobacillus satsumensis]|uniref:hypothetical protein n=1 Tax=Liquorilactobacillus satsumensis TaxID=259059 RepID=UPI0021C30CDC|nr:hypothetical protein [Liquorilactobacillus satsumensis]MCP9313684.1 hypothetical protein [Liquorilactobacillus satsumensis]MCP9360830.1 hypothetical protein [Liquorilactobacillus satsumensis]
MQQTIFETCPTFENEKLSLKRTILADMIDLLKVYSDKKAVLLFNSDNCDGDDFYYNNGAVTKVKFCHSPSFIPYKRVP